MWTWVYLCKLLISLLTKASFVKKSLTTSEIWDEPLLNDIQMTTLFFTDQSLIHYLIQASNHSLMWLRDSATLAIAEQLG